MLVKALLIDDKLFTIHKTLREVDLCIALAKYDIGVTDDQCKVVDGELTLDGVSDDVEHYNPSTLVEVVPEWNHMKLH